MAQQSNTEPRRTANSLQGNRTREQQRINNTSSGNTKGVDVWDNVRRCKTFQRAASWTLLLEPETAVSASCQHVSDSVQTRTMVI